MCGNVAAGLASGRDCAHLAAMSPLDDDPPRKAAAKGPALGLVLALAGAAVVLGLCVWGAIAAWNGAAAANPTSHITGHGWAALAIAFVMVIVVGGGLMWLAFYSARKGYDDRVAGPEE
jgi:hypothetical protein